MRYLHTINAVNSVPWAILPEKLLEITEFLEFAASGGNIENAGKYFAVNGFQNGVQGGGVSVIPVTGVISQRANLMTEHSGGTSIEKLTKSFREAMDNDDVGTVLFRVSSPGGAVPGVPELADEIYNARGQGKRLIALADYQMGSAALWISSAADEVCVIPSGEVGCRGVMAAHVDISKFEEMIGQKTTLIVSSDTPLKNSAHPYQPLSDEERERIQKDVDYYGEMFDDAYARNRGVPVSAVKAGHGRGATLPAKLAVSEGLADRVITYDALISELLAPSSRRRRLGLAASKLELMK